MKIQSNNKTLNQLANELAMIESGAPTAFKLMFAPRIANFNQKNYKPLVDLRVAIMQLQDAHIEKDEKGMLKQEQVSGGAPDFCFKSAEDRKKFEDGVDSLMNKNVTIIL